MGQSPPTVINLGSMLNIYKILLNFLHFARDFPQNICAIENGTVQEKNVLLWQRKKESALYKTGHGVLYGTNKGVLGNRKYKGYTLLGTSKEGVLICTLWKQLKFHATSNSPQHNFHAPSLTQVNSKFQQAMPHQLLTYIFSRHLKYFYMHRVYTSINDTHKGLIIPIIRHPLKFGS